MIQTRGLPEYVPPPGDLAEDAAPAPHLLWATLEAAYPGEDAAPPGEQRLASYIAVPLTVGLSLLLWGVILAVVLLR
ncbi:MAG: hypothetical protein KGK11_08495 [Sphingomonadales bacterium]|nr:hypothetical protein [Sphingomonadales bacterium]